MQFTRSSHNPVLTPDPTHWWEREKVYNPGVVRDHRTGLYHMYYRALAKRDDTWYSVIGHATSPDGEVWAREAEPLLIPDITNPAELRGYEDPRIVYIATDDRYYLTYAVFDGTDVRLHLSVSKDLIRWESRGPMLHDFNFVKCGGRHTKWDGTRQVEVIKPGKVEFSKSGALFPEKIGGKYWMLFGEYRMWLASSTDARTWEVITTPFLAPRPEVAFESLFVEMGPPPMRTDAGWLVLYHGVDEQRIYKIGYLLLDLEDPTKVLKRSDTAIFEPQEPYELGGLIDILPGGMKKLQSMTLDERTKYFQDLAKAGIEPQVVFCCGANLESPTPRHPERSEGSPPQTLRIWYGAGDTKICTAYTVYGSS